MSDREQQRGESPPLPRRENSRANASRRSPPPESRAAGTAEELCAGEPRFAAQVLEAEERRRQRARERLTLELADAVIELGPGVEEFLIARLTIDEDLGRAWIRRLANSSPALQRYLMAHAERD